MAIQDVEPGGGGIFNSPIFRLGKTVAGVATGNVGMAAEGLSKDGSTPFSRAMGVAKGISNNFDIGGSDVSGKRGAMGEANLGVDTDLGYGKKAELEMPKIGAYMRRVSGPKL